MGGTFLFLPFQKSIIMCKWLKESNRYKHLLLAIPVAVVFTFLCALGCAGGLEYKDVQYSGKWSSWDWLDFIATLIGGIIGQAIQLLIIYLIVK